MTEVRTRDEAIASVDRALQVWSTNMVGVLTQGQATARAAKDEIERIARRYANEVAAMEALLGAADDEERRQLQAKLVRVREASEKAERARERVGQVEASVARLNRTHVTAATSLVSSARAQLSAMRRALDGYRSGGADLGGAGSHGGNGGCAGPTSLAGTGLTDVNVSSADLDDNPILDDGGRQGTFGKGGLTRADYRWAVQTWNDTVGPGVAAGKSRDDFALRDTQSSAKPLRRMADVYDMFLGSDPIRVNLQPGGSLNIVNGRHRLLIARELGIKTLPGQVSG
jgi:hypothetical protein